MAKTKPQTAPPPKPLPPLTVRCLDRVRELVALGNELPCVERRQMRKLEPYLVARLARGGIR